MKDENRLIATFSIVAYDPSRKEWGVAVQSKFLAAAAVVSWAEAGAGAVATAVMSPPGKNGCAAAPRPSSARDADVRSKLLLPKALGVPIPELSWP